MNNIARKILLIIAVPVFLFSSVMVLKYRCEMQDSIEYAESVTQLVVTFSEESTVTAPTNLSVKEETYIAPMQTTETIMDEEEHIEPMQTTETIVDEEEHIEPMQTPESVDEEVYEICPIQVDFDALRKKNKDVVAWIYCPDTPINYPVVQAADNDYYIHRLLDGRINASGTLFMDYQNSADLSDWNSLIYGHNMKNGTMFGYLPHYKKQSYFEDHPKMFLLTPEQNYMVEIMSGFVTQADAELYKNFSPDAEKKEPLVQSWLENADVVSGVYPSSEDRFITLSTCSYEYDDARYVLIGVLKELNDGQE